jgi:hypothetical protein
LNGEVAGVDGRKFVKTAEGTGLGLSICLGIMQEFAVPAAEQTGGGTDADQEIGAPGRSQV